MTNNSVLNLAVFFCACAAAFKQLCPYGHGAVPGRGEGRVGKTHTYNKLHNIHTFYRNDTGVQTTKAKQICHTIELPYIWEHHC